MTESGNSSHQSQDPLDRAADALRKYDLDDIVSALGKLAQTNPERAELATMRFVHGWPSREIASSLGMPLREVEAHCLHAFRWLRTTLPREPQLRERACAAGSALEDDERTHNTRLSPPASAYRGFHRGIDSFKHALLEIESPRAALVATLYLREDLSTEEIAARLGIDETTVDNDLGFALEWMRLMPGMHEIMNLLNSPRLVRVDSLFPSSLDDGWHDIYARWDAMRARVLHELRFERVRNATECVRRRLSPEAGSTFSLFIEGRDPAQIAASLDLSQATVSRHLRSIRDMLRHELDQDR